MDIVISLDTQNIQKITSILEQTSDISNVVGYKIGAAAALRHGLPYINTLIRSYTYGQKIIFDYQKLGNDIPDVASVIFDSIICSGVNDIILFPFVGTKIALEWVDIALRSRVNIIFGAYLTHPDIFVDTDELFRLFTLVRDKGVNDFVLPATHAWFSYDVITYFEHIKESEREYTYYMPGFGAQNGEQQWKNYTKESINLIPIIGRSIVDAENPRDAAIHWSNILSN